MLGTARAANMAEAVATRSSAEAEIKTLDDSRRYLAIAPTN